MPINDQNTAPAKRPSSEPRGTKRARQSRSVADTADGKYRSASVSSIRNHIFTQIRRKTNTAAGTARRRSLTFPRCFGTVSAFPGRKPMAPDSAQHFAEDEDGVELSWYARAL